MSINVSQNLLYIYALVRLGLANPNFQKRIQVLRSTLKMANFNYFPDVDSLKGHCSSVQFTLYGHNLKRLAHSTEFSESICILWRVYGASCVPLCLKADGIWVGPVGTWGYGMGPFRFWQSQDLSIFLQMTFDFCLVSHIFRSFDGIVPLLLLDYIVPSAKTQVLLFFLHKFQQFCNYSCNNEPS